MVVSIQQSSSRRWRRCLWTTSKRWLRRRWRPRLRKEMAAAATSWGNKRRRRLVEEISATEFIPGNARPF
ncbi:hypothetical protein OROMI_003518 [Orobanche minor]